MKILKIMIFILIILLCINFNINAGNISFRIFSFGLRIDTQIESATELKFKNIVKQKYDMSCGSAALATVFKYSYNDNINEENIINKIINIKGISSLDSITNFTLLDLKMAAEFFGYNVYGLKGDLDAIKQINLPIIVLLNSPRGPHFVVVRNIDKSEVQVADPALGNLVISKEDFNDQWNNILLAVENKKLLLNNNFDINRLPNPTDNKSLYKFMQSDWAKLPYNYTDF